MLLVLQLVTKDCIERDSDSGREQREVRLEQPRHRVALPVGRVRRAERLLRELRLREALAARDVPDPRGPVPVRS